jgi:putative nucleotidyltransferase with HDIG domain
MGRARPAPTDTQTAADWIVDIGALVSPPDICIRIFELMEDDGVSAQELGDVICRDPSLTARLLRIVNSPFYGFSRRIDTVSRAVAVIGSSELYNLVVAAAATTSFSRIPNFIVNIDTFWRHGVYCGIIARDLARQCRVLHPERLFIAGLLHDIGSLIVYHREPETIRDLLLSAQGDETTLSRRERAAFGFDHADLGALLLDQWHLPSNLVDAVRHHHEPAGTGKMHLETAILHVADAISNHSEQGAFYASPSARLLSDGTAWRALGIDPEPEFVNSVMERAREQYRLAVDLFG